MYKIMFNSYLSGRKITTTVTLGNISNRKAPPNARTVENKSKTFHPEEMYSDQPSPTIRSKASIRNTENKICLCIKVFQRVINLRVRKTNVSQEAQKLFAPSIRVSVLSSILTNIATPLATIITSKNKKLNVLNSTVF